MMNPILLIFFAFSTAAAASVIKDVEETQCCPTVFISSREIIVDNQGALLGKYKLAPEKDPNGNPYFTKMFKGQKYYLFFRVNGTYGHGTNGWTIGPTLNGSMFNIVTRNSNAECPDGISGAYDRDETLDYSFNIECHSDEVKIDCCPKVNVNSSGLLAKNQLGHLGNYKRNGDYNGYPLYEKEVSGFKSVLFFRKQGLRNDGWTITQTSPKDGTFSITTRSMTHCPTDISSGGYDMDKELDKFFAIICNAEIPLEEEKEKLVKEQMKKVEKEEEKGDKIDAQLLRDDSSMIFPSIFLTSISIAFLL